MSLGLPIRVKGPSLGDKYFAPKMIGSSGTAVSLWRVSRRGMESLGGYAVGKVISYIHEH